MPEPESRPTLILCEGVATALTLAQETGYTAVAALHAGNFERVAHFLRKRYPEATIIVASDDDWQTKIRGVPTNVGLVAAKAAAKLVGGVLAIPDFGGVERATNDTDFNDVLCRIGAGVVKRQIEAALAEQLLPETSDAFEAAEEISQAAISNNSVLRESDEATLQRLAVLSSIEYERVRDAEAERLGCRVSVLDRLVSDVRHRQDDGRKAPGIKLTSPEPWPDRVDGAQLLSDLTATIKRFVILPDHAAEACALWVMHAHAIHLAYISPILLVDSPEKRCGKSTLLRILARLSPKALSAASLTGATLFRVIEKYSPTLVVDEADAFMQDNEELRGLINAGHCRDDCYVLRCVGDDHEPTQFSVWGPKIIAGIGRRAGTIEDRAVRITMRRRMNGEKVEPMRMDRTEHLDILARRATRWVADNGERLKMRDPVVPSTLNDRACDNWRILLAIAEVASGDWPKKAIAAAYALSGPNIDDGDEDASAGVRLLADIRNIFNATTETSFTPAALLTRLLAIEESPWVDWKAGKPISSTKIGRLLRPFGIKSSTPVRAGDERKKERRYDRGDFEDAWNRYLPAAAEAGLGHVETSSEAERVPIEKIKHNKELNDLGRVGRVERGGYRNRDLAADAADDSIEEFSI